MFTASDWSSTVTDPAGSRLDISTAMWRHSSSKMRRNTSNPVLRQQSVRLSAALRRNTSLHRVGGGKKQGVIFAQNVASGKNGKQQRRNGIIVDMYNRKFGYTTQKSMNDRTGTLVLNQINYYTQHCTQIDLLIQLTENDRS